MRPNCLDIGAPEQIKSLGHGLVRRQHREVDWRLVEAAVVVELADRVAQSVPAVRILCLNEGTEFFDPRVAVDGPDLTRGDVALPPDFDSLGLHVVAIPDDELLLGPLSRSWFTRWVDCIALGVLLLDLSVFDTDLGAGLSVALMNRAQSLSRILSRLSMSSGVASQGGVDSGTPEAY
jgi:hypothetical protein